MPAAALEIGRAFNRQGLRLTKQQPVLWIPKTISMNEYYIVDPLGRGPKVPPPPPTPPPPPPQPPPPPLRRMNTVIMGGESVSPMFPDIIFESIPVRMDNNANAPPVIYVQSQQHHHAPQQQQHDHHRQPQISSQHDGIHQQEQPYMLPDVAPPQQHAPLITRQRSPYTAAPPQQHALTMSSPSQTSSHHAVQQQQQHYMMPATPPPAPRQQQYAPLATRPQSPYSDVPPQHQDAPSTMRSQPPYTFSQAPMMTTTQQLQLQERSSSHPPIHFDEPSRPPSFYQHGDLPFHHSDSPPELFHQQRLSGRARNTADVASSQSMPLAPHGNSYDGYSRASGQPQHGGSHQGHQGHHQNMNDQVDRQNLNHQYSPANMHDMRYPQLIDDGRQLHKHLPETTPDYHLDTRYYHHGGTDQRHQPMVATNPSNQNTVITQTRSARSEPPPRTPHQHQRHHRESETNYRNGQSHNHLPETTPDYHSDTRYYHHGGSAQLNHPTMLSNNYNQDSVSTPTRSARSEPPPRSPQQHPHHHLIRKSESETNYGQYGTQSSYKYSNNSQYENRNHGCPSHPNDRYTWDALCCDGRRDIDNYGYDMPQLYDNRPNNNGGSGTTHMPGFYVDSPIQYEKKRQQQHRKQQIYRESDKHEYRDPPPTTSINPGYYNTGPISPLSVSIPLFANRPVENQYVNSGKRSPQDSEAVLLSGSSGENSHSPSGEIDRNDLKGQYGYHPNSSKSYHRDHHHGNNGHSNERHPRYGDNNDAIIHAVPRQVVYPKTEHTSKDDRYYYESNAAAPPPRAPPRFDGRDDSSGSSTISPSAFTPSSHRQQGHFRPPTRHDYSSRNDHESRLAYASGHYRDDPSRLRIEIPISPLIATKNNNSNVTSRPPLPNKLVQNHTPNAVHAEKERRKSHARHQIIKEIVSNQLSVGARVWYSMH